MSPAATQLILQRGNNRKKSNRMTKGGNTESNKTAYEQVGTRVQIFQIPGVINAPHTHEYYI